MQTTTSTNDVICLADLAVYCDLDTFKFLIESINTLWRAPFLKALFESLNDQFRTINNNAYLHGEEADFSSIMQKIQSIVDLFDNCVSFESCDYRQTLLGLLSLPEYFDSISIESLDRTINSVFIKELVSLNYSKILPTRIIFRWKQKSITSKYLQTSTMHYLKYLNAENWLNTILTTIVQLRIYVCFYV